MKKILTVVIGGAIISFAITSNVAGQATEKSIAYAAVENYTDINFSGLDSPADVKVAEVTVKASKANLKAMKANFRASENFKKAFKDAPEATWATGEKTIVAYFTKDNLKSQVVFNKTGHLLHSLTFIPAEKTPNNIRSIVEEEYPNADIDRTVQILENGYTFYIVQIEDKRTYKEVSVFNGETALLKEYKKIN